MIFWTNFVQKGYFQSKTEKVNTTTELCIFELVLVSKFQFKLIILFFGPSLPKKGISSQKRKKGKSEHQHWILDIRISLGTKFQLNLTILIFLTKFAKKGYFRSETETSHLCVRSWSLLTILFFSTRGPADTTVF